MSVHTGMPVALLQLEYFSIHATEVFADTVEATLDNFKAPNLWKLNFKLNDSSYEYENFGFHETFVQIVLFPKDFVRWPRLEVLQVRFPNASRPRWILSDDDHALGISHPLHYMLTRLPNIHSLSITYGNVLPDFVDGVRKGEYDIPSVNLSLHPLLSPIAGNESPSLPSLRELTLKNCRFGTEFFSDNLDIFTSPTFKSLHLEKSGTLMDIDVIRDMLPSDKILITNGNIVSLPKSIS